MRELDADEQWAVLVAWQAGDLTEGQAVTLLRCGRIDVRLRRDDAMDMAQRCWDEYRRETPSPADGAGRPQRNMRHG